MQLPLPHNKLYHIFTTHLDEGRYVHYNLYLWEIIYDDSVLSLLFGTSWFRMQTLDSFNQ